MVKKYSLFQILRWACGHIEIDLESRRIVKIVRACKELTNFICTFFLLHIFLCTYTELINFAISYFGGFTGNF